MQIISFDNYDFSGLNIDPISVMKAFKMQQSYAQARDVDFVSPFSATTNQSFGITANSDLDRRLGIRSICDSLLAKDNFFRSCSEFKDFEKKARSSMGSSSRRSSFSSQVFQVEDYFFDRVNYPLPNRLSICIDQAFEYLKSRIPQNSLVRTDLKSVYSSALKTTNWGFPHCLPGDTILINEFGESKTVAELQLGIALEDELNNKCRQFPVLMHLRLQPSPNRWSKYRIVWGFPHSVVLLELSLLHSILPVLKDSWPEFSEHNSKEHTDRIATNMFQQAKRLKSKLIGIDFEKFDKSIIRLILNYVYSLLSHWFQAADDGLIMSLREYMITSDLVTPLGVFSGRDKSVGSGSGLTNLVDCLAQLIFLYTCTYYLDIPPRSVMSLVNGDDGVWLAPGLTAELVSSILKPLGLIVNPSKCSYSDVYFTFCQRFYHKSYKKDGISVGIRSIYRTANSIISYERLRNPKFWNRAMDSVRCISQLTELESHPCHRLFVKAMIEADDVYGLGSKCTNNVSGLYILAGGIDAIVNSIGVSSWDKERVRDRLAKSSQLKTIQLITSSFPE